MKFTITKYRYTIRYIIFIDYYNILPKNLHIPSYLS